jgi:autoaggregation protein RapA/B/C
MRTLSLLFLTASISFGGTLNFSSFSTAYTSDGFYGFAYDSGTGTYYAHAGYGEISAPVASYTSLAAFASNSPSGSITPADIVGGCVYPPTSCNVPDGTYFGVENGELIGRPNDSGTELAAWNASTGALDQTNSYSGVNGSATLGWGGFTGMNVLQDQTGTYLFDVGTDGNWQVSTLGSNLAASGTEDTGLSAASLDYIFLVSGTLFGGNGNQVSYAIDPSTGAVTAANFSLNLPGDSSGYYITDTVYNPNLDQLFLYDNTDQTLYSLSNASVELGVPASTPEPGTLTLLLSPLACVVAWRGWPGRRRPAASVPE